MVHKYPQVGITGNIMNYGKKLLFLLFFLKFTSGCAVMTPFPFSLTPSSEDETYMLEALKEAWKAFQAGEVPVGAVLVQQGRIVSRGHNQVELLQDATAHAEMLSITSAEAALHNWRLTGATLYCTIEPCSMCAGALFLTRIKTLVWGAPDLRHGANGTWTDLFAKQHPTHQVEVRNGIYRQEAASLMQTFFQKRRKDQECP